MACVATVDQNLTPGNIVAWQWASGDRQLINQVEFAYDYDLPEARGQFGTIQVYRQEASVARYGLRPTLSMPSRGLRTVDGAQAILDDRALEVMRRFSDPAPILVLWVFYRQHLLEAGDQVRVTHPHVPNPRTGRRGLSGELFEILDMAPEFAGTLRLTLLWVWALPSVSAPASLGAAGLGATSPALAHSLVANLPTTLAGYLHHACALNPTNGTLHLLLLNASGVSWGELTLDGVVATAPAVKSATVYADVGAISDGSADVHVGLQLASGPHRIDYLRLSSAGAIEAGPTSLWTTDPGKPNLALRDSLLYWLWAGSARYITFGTTSLAGTIQTGATRVVDLGGTRYVDPQMAVIVDSKGNAHVLYTADVGAFGTGVRRLRSVKVSSTGAIVTPDQELAITLPIASTAFKTLRVIGGFRMSNGELVVLVKASATDLVTDGFTVFMARYTHTPTTMTPFVPIFTTKAVPFANPAALGAGADDGAFVTWIEDDSATYPLNMARLAKAQR